MLVATEGGASYSESEYTCWMKDAGFGDVCRINLPGPSGLIVGLLRQGNQNSKATMLT